MRRILSVAAIVGAVFGCVRSDLNDTQGIDCRPGLMVVVANAPFCVYEGGLPEMCPPEVPYPLTDGTLFYCAFEAQPEGAVVRAAGQAFRDTVGGAADALVGETRPDQGPDAGPPPRDLGPPDHGLIVDF